jgi:hypothetical protein
MLLLNLNRQRVETLEVLINLLKVEYATVSEAEAKVLLVANS